MELLRRWLGSLLVLALMACPAVAQEDDEQSPWRPGLMATFEAAEAKAVRIEEGIAFDWQDAAPDPRLPAGEFSAVWRGRLWTQTPGAYRLYCYVQGKVELTLDGRRLIQGEAAQPRWLASEPVELPFGRHPLEIAFRRTGAAAHLALFWSGPDFSLEPIPARFLMHDREASPPADFERGRQLAAAMRCGACHQDAATPLVPAPALDRLAGNIHETWLIEWLTTHGAEQTGRETHPAGRRMPDLAITREEATAVAAWLLQERPVGQVSRPVPTGHQTRPTEGQPKAAKKAKGKKGAVEEPVRPSAQQGERLILTRGCLACHQLGELGESGLFGGGDLTELAQKRPGDFFARWLEDPEAINRHHRMPRFTFTRDELNSLTLWFWRSGIKPGEPLPEADVDLAQDIRDQQQRPELARRGERLVAAFRCAACHALPGQEEVGQASRLPEKVGQASRLPGITASSDWSRSCADQPSRTGLRPGYRLSPDDAAALKSYYSTPRPGEGKASPPSRGRDLLVQLNCLACHQREGVHLAGTRSVPATFADKLAALAETHDELAPLIPAMTPPALNSVGDKLHDAALADAIRRQGPPHRPYLLVEMPKFRLSDDELADLTAWFIATDRIPPQSGAGVPPSENSGAGVPPARETTAGETPTPLRTMAGKTPAPHILAAAGPRLVTTDGFGCTSCHQVGSVQPVRAPLNARGPDISMLEKRIRREWFDRWCANPARITPRMEMPSVQVPVRGVLGDNVRHQLAAVWHTLNTPGFEPPEPDPVRVLRLSGVPERKEKPIVIHDVVKDGERTYLFPLVIGLPNRHNVLFDLETNRLAAWWLGDTARQRTKGKTWYWEMGAASIFDSGLNESDVSVWIDGKEQMPVARGQYGTSLDLLATSSEWTEVNTLQTLWFPKMDPSGGESRSLHNVGLNQMFRLRDDGGRKIENGFQRVVAIVGEGELKQARLRLVAPEIARESTWDEDARKLSLPMSGITIRVVRPEGVAWDNNGSLLMRANSESPSLNTHGVRNTIGQVDKVQRWAATVVLDYQTQLPVDQFPVEPPALPNLDLAALSIAPGIAGFRLPLPDDIMPSALAWDADGNLIFATLKGEVIRALDSDGDSYEDSIQAVADGLATPYGIATGTDYIDVAAKPGLLRLKMNDEGFAYWLQTIADGWGYTDDYHDWAVGLVRGDDGEYYVALPCQQDKRSEAAAKHRGQFLKLVPRKVTPDNPRLFDIEVLSSGHRFPMGIARNREGELFVTDNQGNYNPFNELNHVRKGAHFGFINALEKERGYKPPPLAEPAIDIPHPWTRSVNGICFLDTPAELRGAASNGGLPLAERADHIYGPLEGHLVGCEYDTRRLIRMSLQRVGDTYQGAAYPLSMPPKDVESGLLGPIVCAVKPTTGELYVGEIRDSGWGAGNNIGQIVKIKIEPEKLPCGIAEVRATPTGFTIDFLQPADRAKAADAASYSIASYRREATPAYGGPDLDRRTEKIAKAEVSDDARRVTLTLAELRAGFVYELHLANLAPGGGLFFPDEAHYTLRKIPTAVTAR